MWLITFPGILVIPAIVTVLVQLVHGPQIRANKRRMAAERAAAAAGAEAAQAAERQPKKTSASA